MTDHSSDPEDRVDGRVPPTEVAMYALMSVVLGLFLPGLGVVVGLVLAFSLMRHNSTLHRWAPVALSVVLLAAQIVGIMSLDVGDDSLNAVGVHAGVL